MIPVMTSPNGASAESRPPKCKPAESEILILTQLASMSVILPKQSIPEVLSQITGHWQQKLVASVNSSHDIKIAKIQGEFIWHRHPDTDELFYILDGGPLTLQFKKEDGGDVVLQKGDIFVVPRGVQHCPKANKETAIMIVESCGAVNTGDEL